jgi:hypothetical protein
MIGPLVDGRLRVTSVIVGARPTSDFEKAISDTLKAIKPS